jgi:hypothetical protein
LGQDREEVASDVTAITAREKGNQGKKDKQFSEH